MDIVLTGLWKGFLGQKNARIIIACTKEAQEFLRAKAIDATILVGVLYGSKSWEITANKLDRMDYYGALKGQYKRSEIRACIDYLIQQGYLKGNANGKIASLDPVLTVLPEIVLRKKARKKRTGQKKTTKEMNRRAEDLPEMKSYAAEQDDRLIRIAEDKLGLGENVIEGIADCVVFEKQRLYWFYAQEHHGTEYYPVEFTRHSSQCTTYYCTHHAIKVFEGIYRLEWKKGTCFLISLPECKYIKLRTARCTTTYPTEPFPFVLYTEMPIIKCSFLDEKEKEIF